MRDLQAPAGCITSSQPEPAAASRSVWGPSPPDSAPAGWRRSAQTAPAAAEEKEKNKTIWVFRGQCESSQTTRTLLTVPMNE